MKQTFTKSNPLRNESNLFAEVVGLEELRQFRDRHGLRIPAVIKISHDELVLEAIESKTPKDEDWIKLGEGLAKLHHIHRDQFGFRENNWIGQNPQINSPEGHWGQFFFHNRLMFQVERLRNEKRRLDFKERLTSCHKNLVEWLSAHKPVASLVHGDLWSGNIMFDAQGPWLIDPAVYYGDREVDLAMSKMFGGFAPGFYTAYHRIFPLAKGYEDREIVYNLYHYLNHLNLFGESYLDRVELGFAKIEQVTG